MCDFWMYSVNLGVLIRQGGRVRGNDADKRTSKLHVYGSMAIPYLNL